jgi:RNA polymerase sigma-70 factor (ECF subfamily)
MDKQEEIQTLKKGQIEYLDILVQKYQLKAVRAAFLITQDRSLAEDVVQDTFLRMFRRIHHFDQSLPFLPYFLRSVVNAALNTVRRNGKTIYLDGDPGTTIALLEQARMVESQVEYRELIDQLRTSISELTPRQRAVIVQRYYLEMSENEMAENRNLIWGGCIYLGWMDRSVLLLPKGMR